LSPKPNNRDNYEQALIPNYRLKKALDAVLISLGPAFRDMIIENLQQGGIDLRSNETKYSLKDIRKQLDAFFGEGAADLFMERLGQKLAQDLL
jgi:hypothetical protein